MNDNDVLKLQNENEEQPERSELTKACFEWVEALVTAFVFVVTIFTFLFRIVNISGPSMIPTLHDSDRVVISSYFYQPKDEDVVVITHSAEFNEPIIKRIIATEGQHLKIDFTTGKVYVDGKLLDEPYISGPTVQEGDAPIPEVIPQGYVFVMGDNRSQSLDSRYQKIGLIDKRYILGKADFIVFPFTRLGRIN